jgi:hypothetical protein
MEFRLHEQGPVFAGLVAHAVTDCAAALEFLRDFAGNAPDELVLQGAVLTLPDGLTVTALASCYSGEVKEGERVLKPLRSFGKPLADQFQVMPYTVFQKALDWWAEPGKQHYWRSGFLKELPNSTLGVLAKYGANKTMKRTGFSVEFLGGKATRIGSDATAFAHRTAKYDFLLFGSWDHPSENAAGIKWVNELWGEMKPWIGDGSYVNYLGANEPAERVMGAYGANYARLQAVKAKYDPENFFRINQNIRAGKAA